MRKAAADETGASIIYALIAFLVAAVISGLVITAALSAAKQSAATRESTKSKLALDSAVILLREDVNTVFFREVKTETTKGRKTVTETAYTDPVTPLGEKLSGLILSMDAGALQSDEESFTITTENDTVPEVTGSIYLERTEEADYPYRAYFTVKNPDTGETVYLTFTVRLKTETSTSTGGSTGADGTGINTTIVTTTRTFTFGDPKISNMKETEA